MLTITTLLAIILYLSAAMLQYRVLKGQTSGSEIQTKGVSAIAVLLHTGSLYGVLHQPDGINLGFFIAGSLIGWMVAAIVLISSLRQKIENLFIGVFPMAALTAFLSVWGPDLGTAKFYQGGLIIHILLSILAYSIFTIATFQAFMLSKQNQALKQHHTRGLVASLPPLQTMERLLFEVLWTGMILLTASLITGLLFIENIFAQHLVHKTIFSFLAWIIYAVLLWGRFALGWRGYRAVRWTIVGFFLLMIGFFGSKLVVEILYG